jgi:hypothetical protein
MKEETSKCSIQPRECTHISIIVDRLYGNLFLGSDSLGAHLEKAGGMMHQICSLLFDLVSDNKLFFIWLNITLVLKCEYTEIIFLC